ncbi:MAG: hypothetical protein NTW19_03640 [Planctomycetota bacterium]|nr:hypothetical protein [Planctomycetota bacterium]
MKNDRKGHLLRSLVKKRAPASLCVAEAFLSGSSMFEAETELLINLIHAEFLAEGISPDFSPTALGNELEALLDDVNRVRLRQ